MQWGRGTDRGRVTHMDRGRGSGSSSGTDRGRSTGNIRALT